MVIATISPQYAGNQFSMVVPNNYPAELKNKIIKFSRYTLGQGKSEKIFRKLQGVPK